MIMAYMNVSVCKLLFFRLDLSDFDNGQRDQIAILKSTQLEKSRKQVKSTYAVVFKDLNV